MQITILLFSILLEDMGDVKCRIPPVSLCRCRYMESAVDEQVAPETEPGQLFPW